MCFNIFVKELYNNEKTLCSVSHFLPYSGTAFIILRESVHARRRERESE